MKVETAPFARAIKAAASSISNSSLDILNCARLEAKDGQLEIRVNDTDAEYRQSIPAEGDFLGVIEAKRLSSIASAAPNGSITFDPDDNRVAIKSGRARWTLPTIDPRDFPQMPVEGLCAAVTIPARELADIIKRVAWCASNEPHRLYLCGIYLHDEGGKIRMVAANSHNLMAVDTDHSWPAGAPDVIVPTRFADNLRAACQAYDGDAILSWDERKIMAVCGDVTLTGKLLDASYSDYRRVIPPESTSTNVDPSALAAAVRRVAIVASTKERRIRLSLSPEAVEVSIPDAPDGSATESVSAECAGDFETGVNAGYLMQMLEAIGGETIEIHQQDATAPMRLQRVVKDHAVGVIMPMRI